MSEDSCFNKNKPQMNTDERRCGIDLCGSLGKGMLAKEKIGALGNSPGLTPIGFGVIVHNRITDRENTELKRTGTNSENVSSFGVRTSSLPNFSFQAAENTDLLNNSPGLTTLHPIDEIPGLKKKSVSLIEGFSDNEDMETLKNSSGLTPLNYDSEPPMDACKLRISPRRTLRTQSQILRSKESDLND